MFQPCAVPDINECQQPNKICDYKCLNIPGSFVCACPIGYYLALDKVSCKGKPIKSFLLSSCGFPVVTFKQI